MKRLLVFLLLVTPLFAQDKTLTLEALYDPKTMTRFGGAIQSGFEWLDDTTFVWPRRDAAGKLVEWRVFDIKTGKERPLIDQAKLRRAFADAGVEMPEDVVSDDLTFDARKDAILFTLSDDLWVYRGGALTRLTSAPGEEEQATFSPDGKRVAFVRANNLFTVDLGGRDRQLTTDGGPQILNGKLDYVYQEEVYGRGTWKAYWWSPDSSRIAFLRSDERPVPEYPIVDDLEYRPKLTLLDYPKAGDPNPDVTLHLVAAAGGEVVDVDHQRWSGGDFLIVDVTWAPDSKSVTYQVQNREQTWLDLVRAQLDGKSTTLFRDTTKAWVELLGKPVWLEDGSFLWQSERTGFRHLYHYDAGGKLIRAVTSGPWEVREVHGTDGELVWFSGTERSSLGLDVYRVKLDGTGLQRLSTAEGTHSAAFNPGFTHFVDKWSDIRTPDQVRVHRADGRLAHVVEANVVKPGFTLLRPEFLQIRTSDGVMLDAVMYRPSSFDPSKKYPVYQLLYGGPHAPKVLNKWSGQSLQSLLFLQAIAERGAIAWVVDNRTASGKGAVSAWPAYKNPGPSELRDYEEAIAWLKTQPWVDGNRVALFGWSYGGFLVTYALTHSKSFAAGIAGAPVTDWRNYDSIYTERLMLMPQNNPEGYRASSPRFNAADLHGRLLLIHGTTDDNVHPQNTIQFLQELQKAGKTFDLMLYPRTTHSPTNKETLFHIQRTVLEFLERTIFASR